MPIIFNKKVTLKNTKNVKSEGNSEIYDFNTNEIKESFKEAWITGMENQFDQYIKHEDVNLFASYANPISEFEYLVLRLIDDNYLTNNYIKINERYSYDDKFYCIESIVFLMALQYEDPYLKNAHSILNYYRQMAVYTFKQQHIEALSLVGNIFHHAESMAIARYDKDITAGQKTRVGGGKSKRDSERSYTKTINVKLANEEALKILKEDPSLNKMEVARKVIHRKKWDKKPDTVSRWFNSDIFSSE